MLDQSRAPTEYIHVKSAAESQMDSFDLASESNIGTPQGDNLSHALFIVYLEHVLKNIRKIETLYTQNALELAYADDVDFVSTTDFVDVETIQKKIADFRLNVNNNKTEYTLVQKDGEDWKKVKKVGSLLGDTEDIERRKQLPNLALQKLSSIWIRNDKVKQVTRLNIYRALVKSILLYNCGTWSLTKQEKHKLNTFHRRQLIAIFNIKYTTVIKNNTLYQKKGETPISLTSLEARWRLFGHILRQAINTPPNVAITKYFKTEGSKQRSRPKTSIVTTLRRDLKSHNNDHWPTRLHSITDLDHLRDIAQNRSDWNRLTTAIYRSAQAETSVDVAADGH
ncbi:endonuclease-reverse transcriptase [Elysia marginata]|uniref:Endonuclease-reverse transcriptase n=1 Tax=Elysia marginata TaxID=1093978 RepID=A0AAV4GEN1_9GAST|nr:endonuclease-reverse transcriptase [Elysia marginata]